jgi:predicted MFS family arabinose efflux permease
MKTRSSAKQFTASDSVGVATWSPPWLTQATSPARPRAARFAVATLFFLNGALFATWVARIPALQVQRGFNHAELGLALLALAMGAMVAMPLAGLATARFGSAAVSKASVLLFCAFLPVLPIAPNTVVFVIALILFGAAHGTMDIAMNAHAVEVEKEYRVPIMSSFHALFSIGGLTGAAAGGGLASIGLTPAIHFAIVGALFTVTAAAVFRWLKLAPKKIAIAPSRPSEQRTFLTLLRMPGLAALGTVALCVMMGEGAIADWSGVYLRTVREAPESVAALGYAVFSVAMAVGRLFGDFLSARLGAVRLVRAGGLTAAAGLLGALTLPGTAPTLIGLGLVGLGFSAIVPIVFSAAGRTAGITPAVALATVTTTGYLGFLIGPPVIGFAAEFVGLPIALGIIVATSLLSIGLARAVAPSRSDDRAALRAA